MVIYKITNKITGKCYIGQTIMTLQKRWQAHNYSKRCYILNAAIKKHGKENFLVEEIASYTNLEDLNNAEEYYIDWYNCLTPNGYNLTIGGVAPKHSMSTKTKMSKTRQKMVAEGKMSWLPKKGERRSPNTEFKIGGHPGKEIKSGEHLSSKTEFKKGGIAPNKGRKRIIDKTGKISFIKVQNG